VPPNVPVTVSTCATQDAFAMMAGGSLYFKLSKYIAFRPFEMDYYQTRFSNHQLGTNTQSNWRYTAGVNFPLALTRRSWRRRFICD
jgi:hypothetical protein